MKKRIMAVVLGIGFLITGNFTSIDTAEAQGYPGDDSVFNMYYWRATGWCIETAYNCVGLDPVIIEAD
jgi:hypothetical protein